MLKVLLKKQLLEINSAVFNNKKTGLRKSNAAIALTIVGLIALFVGLGVFFFFVAAAMCIPFYDGGIIFVYFTVVSGAAVFLGCFGSVFNTFSGLYCAKDNELLLSMPIPVRNVLIARLLGTYLMSALYSALVYIPAAIAYFVFCSPEFFAVIGCIWLYLLLTVFVTALSCALGYVVAKISAKLKNKSLITVVVSVAFIAIYYFVYFEASDVIKSVIANGEQVALNLKKYAYPLYALGRTAEGDALSALFTTAIIFALFALTYILLSRSFLKIVTVKTGEKRKVYDGKVKVKSIGGALFGRELKRFLSSATYMLNCSIGSLFMLIISVGIIIAAPFIRQMISSSNAALSKFTPIIGFLLMTLVSGMNTISAASVSMDGKNVWIVQSLPVKPWSVLKSKIAAHMLVTLPFALILAVCSSVALKSGVINAVVLSLATVAFVFLCASGGLFLNLKMPNLKWTSETAAVKNSEPIFICVFGNWLFSAALFAPYFVLAKFLSATVYCVIILAIIAAIDIAIAFYLKNKGSKDFSNL